MPMYEYRCNACKREFEYEQRMSDDDLVKCEACGEDKLEKLISRTAFQLKGGGWYKDLYASAKSDKSTGGEAKGTPGDAATKTDAPAASSSTSESSSASSSSSSSSSSAPSSPSSGGASSSGGSKD